MAAKRGTNKPDLENELSIVEVSGDDPVPDVPPRVERVWVRVEVAHDGLHRGTVHEVAMSERTGALVANGYFELISPPDGIDWAA